MKIGIDIDDTIMNTFETMLIYADKYHKEVLHKSNNPKPIGNSDNSYLQDIYGWTEDELIDFLNKEWVDLIKKCPPKKDASKYINKLYDTGYEIYFITARSTRFSTKENDVKEITKDFLKNNNIKYTNIIFNAKDKVTPCLDNNIDIFIDDSPNICRLLNDVDIKAYLMTSITNKNIKIDNIERVNSWSEIYNKIKEYQKEKIES